MWAVSDLIDAYSDLILSAQQVNFSPNKPKGPCRNSNVYLEICNFK